MCVRRTLRNGRAELRLRLQPWQRVSVSSHRQWSNLGRIWPTSGRIWPSLGKLWYTSGRVGAKLGWLRAIFPGRRWSISGCEGRLRANFGRNCPNSAPKFATDKQPLVNVAPNLAHPDSAECGRLWPHLFFLAYMHAGAVHGRKAPKRELRVLRKPTACCGTELQIIRSFELPGASEHPELGGAHAEGTYHRSLGFFGRHQTGQGA